MDDARIGGVMTLDGIGKQLEAIRSDIATIRTDVADVKTDVSGLKTDVAGLKTDVAGLKTDVAGLKTDMAGVKTELAGFRDSVKEDFALLTAEMMAGFNDARIRDEELRGMMKFGLEAREALRETVEERFDAADRKLDEQTGLLNDVLKAGR